MPVNIVLVSVCVFPCLKVPFSLGAVLSNGHKGRHLCLVCLVQKMLAGKPYSDISHRAAGHKFSVNN